MSYISGAGGNNNDLGWFATPAALAIAVPIGIDGNYATVGSTDTIWIWDSGTAAWVDSGETALGDVVGPASAVDSNFAAYNTTTGKLIKDSGFNSGSFASAGALASYLPLAGGTMTGGLVLRAGTTLIEPLKMVAGTNLTTPVAGVFEFDGTNLFFSI